MTDTTSATSSSHEGSLYGDILRRYQHVERLGHEEVEGLLDGEVVLQDKIDGANGSVCLDPEAGLIIASRNQAISIGGNPPTGFNGFVEYVLGHEGIRRFLSAYGGVLRGEYLIRHSISYPKEAYGHFYVFDIEERVPGLDDTYPTAPKSMWVWRYWTPEFYISKLEEFGIKYIPILARLNKPSVEDLLSYVEGADFLGASQREGLVVKNYNFHNRYGRTTWGKLISADFAEKKKMTWGAANTDPPEMRFVSRLLTQELVEKTIHKVSDEREETPRIQHMAEVLGRVWYDIFREELWDFVRHDKVGEFNFKMAQRLAVEKTRGIALAFYNAVPSVKIKEMPI